MKSENKRGKSQCRCIQSQLQTMSPVHYRNDFTECGENGHHQQCELKVKLRNSEFIFDFRPFFTVNIEAAPPMNACDARRAPTIQGCVLVYICQMRLQRA